MNGLLPLLQSDDSFKQLSDSVDSGISPVLCTGVVESQKWHLSSALMQTQKGAALIVAESELKAKEIFEDLFYFYPDNVYVYPSRDMLFYAADVKSADITKRRFAIVEALLAGKEDGNYPVVVLAAEALLDRLVPPADFTDNIVTLSVGETVEAYGLCGPDALARRLAMIGYERSVMVEGPGQFAIRGGIMDIYTVGGKSAMDGPPENNALRIEFFGDEIDSIRWMDALTQRSVSKVEQAAVYPMRELVYDEMRLQEAIKRIEAEYETAWTNLRSKNKREEAQTLNETVQDALTHLRGSMNCPHIESFFPFFYEGETNLLDYLPEGSLIFFDEPNRINSHIETILSEYDDSIKNRLLKGALLPSQTAITLSWDQMLSKVSAFNCVLYTSITHSLRDFSPLRIVPFAVKSCAPLRRKPSDLRDDLLYWTKQNFRVVILAGLRRHGQPLADSIESLGEVRAQYVDSLEINGDSPDDRIPRGVVTVTRGSMAVGFEYPECGLVVITDKDILSDSAHLAKRRRRHKEGAKIDSFTDLRVGDYVVHENHGIGVYQGMEQIVVEGMSRDYLKLAYADGGHLYVHTGQMELIQKYIGAGSREGSGGSFGDDTRPRVKLNKLGGADWARAKSKARGAIEIMAHDLAALYAKRQTAQGFAYGPDTVWQTEFEAKFPFEETEDQIAAFLDVKRDMESGKVMDRLICGDVGYGKTEVAIRAAFKAVQDNKQVAYLVPTTILAQQHYFTFAQRLQEYPVTVDRLSRFQTRKEQADTVAKLAKGQIDVVIGTHRLLSKDVKFRNLGLIIVDEEQRFGVTHKEKLKALKENVNVLTLTATPIPRTLHLSMTGLRDMSLLNEPPMERLPVQTYVMEYSGAFVRDAINRELARGGQVYYLHNRVRNIIEEAARVGALVPSAKVAYAHGQMSEHELENVMMKFVDGEIDVLVCTTIVETGLDIQNVNTIVIQDADFMGLSQLYQLRGRVGRSNRQAYAYLMYRKDKVLDEKAEKRLQTIREFTEFGSGFKIAMRDLEIRGTGNLLGAEQHGHMESVGYDMYCRLLAEAVAEQNGTPVKESFETTIDIQIDAYIPDYFIGDEMQKLETYKKISQIENRQDAGDVQEEIEDRFGELPKPVQNLLDVALVKAAAHAIGVISVKQKGSVTTNLQDSSLALVITFKANAEADPNKLTDAVKENIGRLFFTAAPNPYLTFYPGRVAAGAAATEAEKEIDMLRALERLVEKLT